MIVSPNALRNRVETFDALAREDAFEFRVRREMRRLRRRRFVLTAALCLAADVLYYLLLVRLHRVMTHVPDAPVDLKI